MELPGPVHDRQQIMDEHGQGIQIKQQWEDNPKAPLANYLGGGTGGASHLGDGGKGFQVEEGMIEGKKYFRCVMAHCRPTDAPVCLCWPMRRTILLV